MMIMRGILMVTDTTQMTIRRLAKGQIDKIKRVPNWKPIVAFALQVIYRVIGTNLDAAKIRIIRMDYLKTDGRKFNNAVDPRIANNLVYVLFKYGGTLHYLACDANHLKFMLTKTKNYILAPYGVEFHDIGGPYWCVQANNHGELDPRPWKGIPLKDHFAINFTNGGQKK